MLTLAILFIVETPADGLSFREAYGLDYQMVTRRQTAAAVHFGDAMDDDDDASLLWDEHGEEALRLYHIRR